MRMATRPASPATIRTMWDDRPRGGMKSMRATAPASVSRRVSRMRVPGRYRRLARALGQGAMRQKPLVSSPSNEAKQASESNLGQHSQSIVPPRSTRAAVSQSPMRAWSSIRLWRVRPARSATGGEAGIEGHAAIDE